MSPEVGLLNISCFSEECIYLINADEKAKLQIEMLFPQVEEIKKY